ncbi:uncharacterized protein LOC124292522 [Haliotis rubra]|uniref:uncharacterized protein LOC124292522 n=1 Tax=Haliotis rubra TaxID=36100 RepID=UPI001EE5139D|nr:uncharacterized protein LOC124292522 [Haliotis rubra]
MKTALVFLLLLVVIVIPSAESWGRRRWFRVRVPRIRVRLRRIFHPVTHIWRKVVKPVVKTIGKGVKIVIKPILRPIQETICPIVNGKRDTTWETEYHYVESRGKRAPVEGTGAEEDLEDMEEDQSDMMMTRRAQEMEDWLEMYDKEGRVLEGLNELVNTKRDVRELNQVLQDPVRSKRLLTYVGKALCGKPVKEKNRVGDGKIPDKDEDKVEPFTYNINKNSVIHPV